MQIKINVLGTALFRRIKEELGLPFLKEKGYDETLFLGKLGEEVDVQRVEVWSTNNRGLVEELQRTGYLSTHCCKAFYYNYYTNLNLSRMQINLISPDFQLFVRLKYVNLSFNSLQILEYLPPSVKEVQASFNFIVNFRHHDGLEALGLVKNSLRAEHIAELAAAYPNLKSLDLSHNLLTAQAFPELLLPFRSLSGLKLLALRGNECSDAVHYRQLVSELEGLKYLD